jgi:hypothetical protein
LSGHPKFQKYVDAQDAQSLRDEGNVNTERMLEHITRTLPRESLARFESLRRECVELRQIAMELRNPGRAASEMPLEEFQTDGLDRLLWIYLRLLFTQFALARFLQATSQVAIEKQIKQLEERLAHTSKSEAPSHVRARAMLEDNLQTSRARLENFAKAKDNYALVQLEIDRLENKIRSLSEMAVNRQEPQFISSQVDQVAASMLDTEKTMNELQFATGLHEVESEAPELLRREAVQVRQ